MPLPGFVAMPFVDQPLQNLSPLQQIPIAWGKVMGER